MISPVEKAAIALLKKLKADLMYARCYGQPVLATYRNTVCQVEGDIDDFLQDVPAMQTAEAAKKFPKESYD